MKCPKCKFNSGGKWTVLCPKEGCNYMKGTIRWSLTERPYHGYFIVLFIIILILIIIKEL